MLVIFGGMEGIIASTEFDGWLIFFCIIGALTVIAGIVNIFVMPKDTLKPNKEEPYVKNIFYGFRPTVIKRHVMLYVCLIAFMLFSIAIQVFFPYFMIYIEHGLKISGFDFILTLGIVLVLACIITVVFGLFMDKLGKSRIMIPALGVTIVGAILMFFLKEQIGVMIGGTILMSGYMVSTAVLNAKIRDYTPEKEAGLFQGVRMIFSVCVPMVTGPFIGEALYKATTDANNLYENDYGEMVIIPNEWIFLGAAIVLVVAVAPLIFIIIKENKMKKAGIEPIAPAENKVD
jgi:MFS family permease